MGSPKHHQHIAAMEGVDEHEVDANMEIWFFSDSSDSEQDYHIEEDGELDHLNVINSIVTIASSSTASKKIELTNVHRKDIVNKLLLLGNPRILPKGKVKELATEYGVHRSTIHRIWAAAKTQLDRGNSIDVGSKKKGRVGRKPKCFDLNRLSAIPIEKRTTIRALASALGNGVSCVYRLIKSGQLRAHTNSIKPTVKHHNKILRLEYIMRQIIPRTIHSPPKFEDMYNVIHIDEKWFYMSQETQRFYLFPWESEPYRATQNKKFIPKVMFIAVVARPIISPNGEVLWDGKIGIFPFTEVVYAKKSCKNRQKGTAETKPIQRITQQVIREKIIKEVLPAIREKWPTWASKEIWIQQDNARPHISVNDEQFKEAALINGFNKQLSCQPAQNPDLNVLDLGFFRAIQSLQYKTFPKNVNDLVKSVQDAFEAYDPKMMNYTWLQLQYVMLEIMKVKGGNNYKNPHVNKQRLDRLGFLPTQVEVPDHLLTEVVDYLNDGRIRLNEDEAAYNDLHLPDLNIPIPDLNIPCT